MRRPVLVCAAVVTGVLSLSACKTTVVETAPTTIAPGATTTTSPLPATTADRLGELVTLSLGLGDKIFDGGARPDLDRIDALWAAATPTVRSSDPALGRQVDHELSVLHTGVDRKRPADADKAARNLELLIKVFRTKYPDS